MKNKWIFPTIIALFAITVYSLIRLYHINKSVLAYQEIVSNDNSHVFKFNFWTNLQNCHMKLENVTVKDSLSNIVELNDIMNGREQLLVYRFSDSHCESCIDASIRISRQWVDSIGKDNMLFWGKYRNNKIFNISISQYSIRDLNVYNSSMLNIPAEELHNPYYFVLNSDMTISNIFVPDRALPAITESYFKAIHERYFTVSLI